MKRRFVKEDEESLLHNKETDENGERNLRYTRKIPGRAIKPIIVAILLVLLGIMCLIFLVMTYTGSMYYVFGDHRFMLLSIGLLTTCCGGYTLYVAYNCYYMIGSYRWPMIFL